MENLAIQIIDRFQSNIKQVGKEYILDLQENEIFEFKKSLQSSKSAIDKAYLKTIAGFANNKGGVIIFGVEPENKGIVGIKDKYENLDNRLTSTAINEGIDGAVGHYFFTSRFHGTLIGFLLVDKSTHKPVIVKQSYNNSREQIITGDIYYRYSGQTTKIRAADLRRILEEEMSSKVSGILNQITKVVELGPENSAVLDKATGELTIGNQSNNKFILTDIPHPYPPER